jgi:hypothetical protein
MIEKSQRKRERENVSCTINGYPVVVENDDNDDADDDDVDRKLR